jgi:type II secretory pathway component PulM
MSDGVDNSGTSKRLSHVEQQISSIKTAMESLSGQLTGLMAEFRTFVGNAIQDRKPNWIGILGSVGVIVAVVVWYQDLALKPLKEQISRQESQLDDTRKQLGDTRENLARLEERLRGRP